MFQPQPKHVGLLRVVDACQIVDSASSTSDPQRSVEFTEANFTQVTANDVLQSALTALHPDKPVMSSSKKNNQQQQQGEWLVAPQLCAQDENAAGQQRHRDGGGGGGGFVLPPQASLLSAGLCPGGGTASEVYLTGKWRWFVPSGHQRDVVVATVDAATPSYHSGGARSSNNNNNDSYVSYFAGDDGVVDASALSRKNYRHGVDGDDDDGEPATSVSMGFVPSVVQVTLWSVPEKPVYEIDVRRPLSTITGGKMKKIVSKFSGIPVSEIDLDVEDYTVRDDSAKLFPFIFDPSVVPQVRVRTKDDNVVTLSSNGGDRTTTSPSSRALQQRFLQSQNSSAASAAAAAAASRSYLMRSSTHHHHTPGGGADQFSSSPRSRARVEAEYGAGFLSPVTHTSPMPGDANGTTQADLQQVNPERSRDWASWLEQRRVARDLHVRTQLVPSSKEQIEVERALQVKTLDDVRNVTKSASLDLASSAQLLHQKLECVREEILRERLGDQGFAKIEGSRAMNGLGPVKTSVDADGVNREPLVVSFR